MPLVRAGDHAPEFTLPAADGDGTVGLRDHLDRGPVLLGLYRGIYCAFCRRAVAGLGRLGPSLARLGTETLAVVATPAPHARVYFTSHRLPIVLAADPALTTHTAYGLPKMPKERWDLSTRINPTGELSEPLPVWEANKALGQLDLFKATPTDRADMEHQWNQAAGLFLIDGAGTVRWAFVEAQDGPMGIGIFPPEAEVVNVVQTLLRREPA